MAGKGACCSTAPLIISLRPIKLTPIIMWLFLFQNDLSENTFYTDFSATYMLCILSTLPHIGFNRIYFMSVIIFTYWILRTQNTLFSYLLVQVAFLKTIYFPITDWAVSYKNLNLNERIPTFSVNIWIGSFWFLTWVYQNLIHPF